MSKSIEMSRIYRLEFDPSYQSLALADPSLLATPAFHFDSTSKSGSWEPIDLIKVKDDKPEPDFWKLEGVPVGFVCDENILGELQTLENIIEALPVHFGSRTLYLVHVNECGCWDALDNAHCVWPSGTLGIGVPSRYAFLPSRLCFTTVMTVPETCEHEIYVYSYCDDPVHEFKAEVENQKMMGLAFKKIWSENMPILR
jgi:hypothetical protein